MNSSASGPVPPCSRGHTATFDPDSKAVFVYGGLREGQRYNELYILNTLTWMWRLVTVGLLLESMLLEESYSGVLLLSYIKRKYILI